MTHFSALYDIGVENKEDYIEGNWFGNSSLDGMVIFKSVTYNLPDLINSIEIHFHSGDKVVIKRDNFNLGKPLKSKTCISEEKFPTNTSRPSLLWIPSPGPLWFVTFPKTNKQIF